MKSFLNNLFYIFAILALLNACSNNETKTPSTETPPTEKTSGESPATPSEEAPAPMDNVDSDDKQIIDIKTNYKIIESKLDSYERRIVDIISGDGAGGKTTGFYENGKPVKIETEIAQGHSAETISYYLKDGALFFVFKQNSSEASLHGPYTDEEQRIYIHNGNVIKLLEKEATYKEGQTSNLANVENVDVTAKLNNGTQMVQRFMKEVSNWRSQMER